MKYSCLSERWVDSAYWNALLPELNLVDPVRGVLATPSVFDEDSLSAAADRFAQEGWFAFDQVLDPDLVSRLRDGLMILREAGELPVFIYLFEEAWQVFWSCRDLLHNYLGEDLRLLPHFWAWHLDPQENRKAVRTDRGWPPHRDYGGESVAGEFIISLSLWIPLTDATPDNGCISLLPLDREAAYAHPVNDPCEVHLQDVQALPARAGSVLGWRQDVYHWGGRASSFATTPRLSLSLEFQNPAFEALAETWLEPDQPPNFAECLGFILAQIGKYQHMQNLDLELCATAREAEVLLAG